MSWAFSSGAVTGSFDPTHARMEIVGIRWEALAATTAKLVLETTEDPPSVDDASATWDAPTDQTGTAITVVVTAGVAGRAFMVSPVLMAAGRCRWRAVDASDVDVAQGTQVIVPKTRMF